MTDSKALLEQIAACADSTALPTAADIRKAVSRRRRRGALAAVAATVTAVGAGAAVLGAPPSSTPRPSPPITTPTTDPTPTTTARATAYGDPVRVAPDLDRLDLRAVTYREAQGGGRSVYIVVGDSSIDSSYGQTVRRPIWWSDDARTWHHASTGPDTANVWDVAAYGGGFVAIAPQGMHASTSWLSADGDHWYRGAAPANFRPYAVSASLTNDASYGAFAWADDEIYMLDGIRWTKLADQPQSPDDRVCFVKFVEGQPVIGARSTNGKALAWVWNGHAWRNQPSPSPTATNWCEQHGIDPVSATGPAGTVTVLPNDDAFDTVYLKEPSPTPAPPAATLHDGR